LIEHPKDREEGPTLTEVSNRRVSIEEAPAIVPQEERLQEQEQEQQKPKISKRKQKRRTTTYLSNISKQVEKNGNQINKITIMIQSLQKLKQTKSTKGAIMSQSSLQSIKQIQSQVNLLQKQVARIQNDIQKIRITPRIGTTIKAKFKKLDPSIAKIKPRSKKSKPLNSIKIRRGRRSRR
jgi:hypothetical protein